MKNYLLLVALLLFCSNVTVAQAEASSSTVSEITYASSPTRFAELTSGIYVIKVRTKQADKYLYHAASQTSAPVFMLGDSYDNNAYYLWNVTVSFTNSDSTIVLQNADTKYFPKTTNNGRISPAMVNTNEAATLAVKYVEDDQAKLAESRRFYCSGTSFYLISNGADGSPTSIDYWKNGNSNELDATGSNAAAFSFFKVSGLGDDFMTNISRAAACKSDANKGYVGCYKTSEAAGYATTAKSAYTSLFSTLSVDNVNSLNTAITRLEGVSADTIALEEGKYYQLKCHLGNYSYVGADDVSTADGTTLQDSVITQVATPSEVGSLWTFEKGTDDNTYYIKSANAEMYITYTGHSLAAKNETDANSNKKAIAWKYNAISDNQYSYSFGVTSAGKYLSAYSSSADKINMSTWASAHAGTKWYIIPVETISLNIYTDTGWASACYPFAVTLPDGLNAYTVTGSTDTEVTLTPLGTSAIPAKTPVFITASESAKGTTSDDHTTYKLTINTEAAQNEESSVTRSDDFCGTTLKRVSIGEGSIYALTSNGSNGPVLKKNASGATEMPANHAYLNATSTNAENSAAELQFTFGTPTGIAASLAPATDANDTYYDLRGRRVLYPTHGIFVKVGGQKVYIK